MKLVVGADHAGFLLKQALAEVLRSWGHDVIDVGTTSERPVDYPDYAFALSRRVLSEAQSGECRGILICGSGVGASIAANKVKGIRAGLCHDSYSAHQGVEHDDMNVIVFGSRVIALELATDLLKNFLAARFTHEERHVRRLAKITAYENGEEKAA